MSDGMIFGDLPTARQLPGEPDRPAGTFGPLRAATPDLVDVLRRHIREIDADNLERHDGGIYWTDTATGDELELVRGFVDPVAPGEANCIAFAIRGGYVVPFKARGDQGPMTSQLLGSVGGGHASGRERVA